MAVKAAQAELEQLFKRSAPKFIAALNRMAAETFPMSFDTQRRTQSINRFTDILTDIMALSDIMGRRRLRLEAEAASGRKQPQEAFILFNDPFMLDVDFGAVGFEEAATDILTRRPELAVDRLGNPLPPGEAYKRVQEIYRDRHAFALAKSTNEVLTKRVQKEVQDSLAAGRPVDSAADLIAGLGDFTRAYAQTVYRTNVAQAYSAGRFAQLRDPAIARVMGAFEFQTAGDDDVRDSHQDLDGMIAGFNDPVWDSATPPLSYNCRCSLRMVDRFELERNGLLKDGKLTRLEPSNLSGGLAGVERGFGMRADKKVYGDG